MNGPTFKLDIMDVATLADAEEKAKTTVAAIYGPEWRPILMGGESDLVLGSTTLNVRFAVIRTGIIQTPPQMPEPMADMGVNLLISNGPPDEHEQETADVS